jgi:hypothetical protein
MANEVLELKRLNESEIGVIIQGLRAVTHMSTGWAASALLENDAEFIRGLFWTSK